jgi:hypothetical protein
MAGFIFLGLGLLCAFIGRAMLMLAAFSVSVWWGLGVFLPFGPIVFRLSYPELANPSRWVRLAALPCLFMYFLLSPGLHSSAYYRHKIKGTRPPPASGYALEVNTQKPNTPESAASRTAPQLTIPQRMQANAAEFERLHSWSEALRLRKRDLLNSDAAGNRNYQLELVRYNQALQTATAEKNSLAAAK